jgi:hypothetical protein
VNYGQSSIDFAKRAATNISEHDKEVWGLITDVPRLSSFWPYVCAILNVVLAGSGTILCGCLVENGWNKT